MDEDDDDTIFVIVKARVDEASADEAEHKLREKFSHATDGIKDGLKDLGGKIGDAMHGGITDRLTGSAGGALGDVWNDLGNRAGSALGKSIGSAVHDALGGDFGNMLGSSVGPILDELKDVGSHLDIIFGQTAQHLQGLGDSASGALDSLVSGDGGGTLSGVSDLLHHASALGDQLGSDRLSGLGKYGDGVDSAAQLLNSMSGQSNDNKSVSDIVDDVFKHGLEGAGVGTMIPGLDATGIPETIGAVIGGGGSLLHDLGAFDRQAPSPLRDPVSDNWSSTVAKDIDITSSTATISAGTISLGGVSLPSSLTGGSSGGVGRQMASGISTTAGSNSGLEDLYAGGGGTTIGKGHYDQGTGTSGILPGDSPGYDNMLGILPSGQAVGLEGGEGVVKPAAMQNPAIANLVAGANAHFDDGTSGTTVNGQPTPSGPSTATPSSTPGPGGPQGGNQTLGPGGPQGQSPTKQSGPGQAGQPAQPAKPGQGESVMPNQTDGPEGQEQPGQVGDPHGTGQGFGISGGLIGTAESAASSAVGAAANVAAPGSGGAAQGATNAAMQEVNNAIGFAGQLSSIFAFELPIDTLGLDDSPLGDPENSWYGKLGLGLVGGHNDTPNMAGKTQAPLTGGNGPGQQGNASPLGGQQGGGGGLTVNIGSQTNNGQVDHDSNWQSIQNQMNAGPSMGPGQ